LIKFIHNPFKIWDNHKLIFVQTENEIMAFSIRTPNNKIFTMKKTYYFLSFFLLFNLFCKAQDFLPFASSNYAGITGVQLQPASIADSRYKFDMAISASNVAITNNYFGFDPYLIWHPKEMDNLDIEGPYVSRNMDGKTKSVFINEKQDIFSFMVSLSDKDAIAFTPSVRSVVNLDNMSEQLASLLDDLDQETDPWGIKLKDENVNIQMNSWVEYGFTYARILMDKEEHFLKGGATLKITQGMGSAYIFVKDFNYLAHHEDTISFYNSYSNYGTSNNISQSIKEDVSYKFDANPSLAMDLGFVYEYRPQWLKYKYDMDGKTNIWRRDQDKYLFRVGFTLSDLGSVRYMRNPISRDFNIDTTRLYTGDLEFNTIGDFNAFIDSTFTFYDITDSYNMNLPLNLSMQLDVRVANGFYVNFTPYLALRQGNDNVNRVHYLSSLNFIPRYDKKWFGVSLPIQYNALKQWNFGLGIRLGPLWVGWNDMFSTLTTSKNRYGTSASAILKIPILYKHPKDKDSDKVSNKIDKCPDIAGLYELSGCPDADSDGITDLEDRCPTEAGVKEMNGCPDMDGDGITDGIDQCPDVKGLESFNGCPDSDGDSLIDQKDDCPFNAGTRAMNGCPDQDSDGIADKDDNCPTVAGTRENNGCPFMDADGDGIKDEADNCPGLKGPIENNGCPYQDTDNDSIPDKDDDCPSIAGKVIFKGCPDTDGDGISDKNDACPTVAGVGENNGCPEIKKEELEILLRAFDNLEFETGKSVIKKSSFTSLNILAELMARRTDFKLSLTGHTDNEGSEESNLALSKTRTLAVKNYLVQKGTDASRIKTEWFGQTMPVATNATAEGRKKNRRVEMSIVFE